MKKKKTTFSKKLNRTVKLVQLTVTAIVAAVTIYSMIPKNEKIKNVDTHVLADNCAQNVDTAEAEVQTEV